MGGFSSSVDISNLTVSADLDAVSVLLADAENDIDVLLSRVGTTAATATALATAQGNITTLLARITEATATAAALATAQGNITTILARVTAAVATASALATAQTDLTTLISRVTAAVATASALATAQGNITTLLTRIPEAAATAAALAISHARLLIAEDGALAAAARCSTIIGQCSAIQSGVTDTYLNFMGRVPGEVLQKIKTLQRGTIAFTTELSLTATITAVDTAKALLMPLGVSHNITGTGDVSFRLTLTNSTTITATRGNATSGVYTVGYQIVEFQ